MVQVNTQKQSYKHGGSNSKKQQTKNLQSISEKKIKEVGSKRKDLHITFDNPNTEDETAKYLAKLLSQHMVDYAMKNER